MLPKPVRKNSDPSDPQISYLNSTGPSDSTLKSFQPISSRDYSSNPISQRDGYIAEESLESSSSVQLEDSQDILVLGRRKPHGCQGTFSEQYGIKLKKLRKSRYSEHMPKKVLHLQVDQDVQPEIASVKSSFISTEIRERAVSCYTKANHMRSSFVEADVLSEQSSEDLEIPNEDVKENIEDADVQSYQASVNVIIEEVSAQIDSEPNSRSRSIDLVAEINGKVFKYFQRQVLCQVHLVSFEELIKDIYKIIPVFRFKSTWNMFCCSVKPDISEREERMLENLIDFSMQGFRFDDQFHLKLLLGAYCKVTENNDWPSHDKEWLEMGFASTDLNEELRQNGPIGLLYIFFLADRYSMLLQEMLGVCKYFSYEVFNVCKYFIVESLSFARKKGLHKVFKTNDTSVVILFSFSTGMLIQWFEMMTQNKDFDKSFTRVVKKAVKDPMKYLEISQKHVSN